MFSLTGVPVQWTRVMMPDVGQLRMHSLGSLGLREVVLLLQLLVQLALGSILQDQEHPFLHVQQQQPHPSMSGHCRGCSSHS